MQFQLYVCIADLTEQKAEVMERRLSTVPQPIGSETPPPSFERRRTRSILEKGEPKSVATVQSSMASERLSFIALFEGCTGITLSVGTMVIGERVHPCKRYFTVNFLPDSVQVMHK